MSEEKISEEEISAWKYLCRAYLDLQQLRMSCYHRLRKMKEAKAPQWLIQIMEDHYQTLKAEEKDLLEDISVKMKEKQPLLYSWCENVKGLGVVACLMFLGFINPLICDTAGKAKAYFGVVPGAKLKAGKKGKYNPHAKGRLWLITRNVIMQKDDYYYPLFQKKKEYYLNTRRKVFRNGKWIDFPPFKEIIANPKICPRFEECERGRKAKAERLKRKAKKPACKLHVHMMSVIWLAGILVSHAAELYRESLGLPTDNFKAHKDYIPPKPF